MSFLPRFAALMIPILPAIAMAQPEATSVKEGAAPSAQPGGGGWSVELGTQPTFTFQADMDDEAGEVSIIRTDFSADFAGPIGDRLRLTVGLFGGVANYDFEDFNAGGFTDAPLDDAYEAGVSLLGIYSLDDPWFVVGRGSFVAGWADDADIGDAVFGSAAVGVGYKFSDRFSLALGGGVITRLEDNIGFLPLVVLNWKISDTVTLATTGVGLKLSAEMNDQWTVFLRGGGEFHQYRLDDDAERANGERGGVLNDTRVPVGVGFDWKPAAGLTVSLEVGAIVWQEYELRDDDRRIQEIETDPAAYIGAGLSYRF
ncbi:MAG: DUF6268 family outer membrane beta-barrel protein [Phycisphaerales bacterium]